MMKASYTSRHYDLEDALLRTFPKELSRTQSLITGLQQDARTASQNLPPDPDHFRITILGKVYTEKKEAGATLLEACKQSVQDASSILGEYAGFTLSANYSSFSRQYHLSIAGQIIHDIELGDDPSGNLTRTRYLRVSPKSWKLHKSPWTIYKIRSQKQKQNCSAPSRRKNC